MSNADHNHNPIHSIVDSRENSGVEAMTDSSTIYLSIIAFAVCYYVVELIVDWWRMK